LCYGEELRRLGDISNLHIDIEDGNFVPNITFGLKSVQAVASATRARLDAHLMTTRPDNYIDKLAALGVRAICLHIECTDYPLVQLGRIRALGLQAGLALNFKTPLEELQMFLPQLDYLLVMTGEPDSEALEFRPAALERLRRARALLPPGAQLWADGGIGPAQLPWLVRCGVDAAVMGRALFQTPDPAAALKEFEKC